MEFSFAEINTATLTDTHWPAESWRRRTSCSSANAWVEGAIAAGLAPIGRQRPLPGEDAGEWRIVTSKAAINGAHPALPEEWWDEVFVILAGLGRVAFDRTLKPWHGDCLAENRSTRATALRMRLVRQALEIGTSAFYGPIGIDTGIAEAIEASGSGVNFPFDGLLEKLSTRHRVPLEWLDCGMAQELVLRWPGCGSGRDRVSGGHQARHPGKAYRR